MHTTISIISICLLFISQLHSQATKEKRSNSQYLFHNIVVQCADSIIIRLENGQKKILLSNNDDGGNFVEYKFIGQLYDLPFFIFDVGYYEGSQVLLIDGRSGREYYINDKPCFSPDHKFIATASYDLEASYNPNELNVWRIDQDSLTLVYSVAPNDWGPTDINWLNNITFTFNQTKPNEVGADSIIEIKQIELVNNTWVIK